MTEVFGDTFYFLALVNANDEFHERAVRFSAGSTVRLVTSAWVLTELADGLAGTHGRQVIRRLVEDLRGDDHTVVVEPDRATWNRGIELYATRPDKRWSLTDCISFAVMSERSIVDALTGDHHFEQAGFRILLKD